MLNFKKKSKKEKGKKGNDLKGDFKPKIFFKY